MLILAVVFAGYGHPWMAALFALLYYVVSDD
jgi:hypothetical protein